MGEGRKPDEAVSMAIQERRAIIETAAKAVYSDPLLLLDPLLAAVAKMEQMCGFDGVGNKIAAIHSWDRVRYYASSLQEAIDYLVALRESMQGQMARGVTK